MTQVVDPLLPKRALGALEDEAMLTQSKENRTDVLQMLRPCPAENENIVKENKYAPPEEWLQHRVHQRLEGRRRIGEAERHHEKLKVPVVRPERRLGDVVGVHADLMIPTAQVQLGEKYCTLELVKQFFNNGNGKLVTHCLAVQSTIVHTEPPRAISFAHQ